MRLYDIDGDLVNVDVRESRYPLKFHSKSLLQGEVANALQLAFPRDPILEEFTIPGSRMSVDFFIPTKRIVVEVQGEAHDFYVPFFHKGRELCKYAKQVSHDRKKEQWSEMNKCEWVEIRTKEDLESWLKNYNQ